MRPDARGRQGDQVTGETPVRRDRTTLSKAGNGGNNLQNASRKKVSIRKGGSRVQRRLTFDELDRHLIKLQKKRGPGGIKLLQKPIGELLFDRNMLEAFPECDILLCREAFNIGLHRAGGVHHGNEFFRYCYEHQRAYFEALAALKSGLVRVLDIPVEFVAKVDSRGGQLAYEQELLGRLKAAIDDLPKPDLRKGGAPSLHYPKALANMFAEQITPIVGTPPPLSRSSWFTRALAAGWLDAGLPDVGDENVSLEEWLSDAALHAARTFSTTHVS